MPFFESGEETGGDIWRDGEIKDADLFYHPFLGSITGPLIPGVPQHVHCPDHPDADFHGGPSGEFPTPGSRSSSPDPRSPTTPFGSLPFGDQQSSPAFEEEDRYQHPNNPNQDASTRPAAVESQEHVTNNQNPQDEPSEGLSPADIQPLATPSPAIPAIDSDVVHGSGRRPIQGLCCGDKCSGSFAGLHKCSRRGRSLTISCHGNDNSCRSEFSRRNEFNRHWKTVHCGGGLHDCPVAGCERVGEKGFKRKDNVTQHRRLVHEETIQKIFNRYGSGSNDASGAGPA